MSGNFDLSQLLNQNASIAANAKKFAE